MSIVDNRLCEEPLSETMLYILYSLQEMRHGYGIMLYVKELTLGYLVLGAGTVYQSLSKMEKKGWISFCKEADRRRYYIITTKGKLVLVNEIKRIQRLYNTMKEVIA